MKEIKLQNSDKIALIDDEDYDRVSLLSWKLGTHNHVYCWHSGYRLMSRFIMRLKLSVFEVDHIDHNTLNNQKSNLRICSSSENKANTNKHKDGSSKYKGVGFDKSRNKWKARLMVCGKNYNIGRFETEEEAAKAYNEYATKYGGEFMLLNNV